MPRKPDSPPPERNRELIISSAYRVFAELGLEKTTIKDIAKEAGLSRPTFYKYYSGKDEILNDICLREALRLHEVVKRSRISREDPIETVVESILLAVRSSHENLYMRHIVESLYFQSLSINPEGAVHRTNREWWRRLLERATAASILAPDLGIDDIVTWLTLSQAMLLMKIDSAHVSDDELKAFIRRYIIPPLLPTSGRLPNP